MERLQNALERLTPLLDQLPIGVQLIDGAMRYRYLNRVAANHSKPPPAQLLGRTMQECYPGIETTNLFRKIRETIATSTPCEMELIERETLEQPELTEAIQPLLAAAAE